VAKGHVFNIAIKFRRGHTIYTINTRGTQPAPKQQILHGLNQERSLNHKEHGGVARTQTRHYTKENNQLITSKSSCVFRTSTCKVASSAHSQIFLKPN